MPDISFKNTEIAFQSKSVGQLRRAHLLFRALGLGWLVNAGPCLVNLAFSLRLPVKGIIRRTVFAQFCGGENIEDCTAAIQNLWKYKVGTILDYSVEGEETTAVFEACTEEIIRTIEKAKGNPAIPFSVFKVTGIARFDLLEKIAMGASLSPVEQAAQEAILHRMDTICGKANEYGVRLFIDAEESWVQPAIDNLAETMMARYNMHTAIVYNTVQLYLSDKLEYLKELHKKATAGGWQCGVKLVRGAYMEKERERALALGYPNPIQLSKAASDADYNEALEFCIEQIQNTYVCAGTHNEESSMLLVELMNKHGVDKADKRIYFSQLLGMSDHISYNLANAGYNVAKYVPYGPVKAVLPYLIRRAQENTSAKGQAGRELTLIQSELRRRKGK
ncbi:MAG: proline dehydrogenase [Flavobacteriaceae bacterium]|nr:proline dehydrogenase [Flavobacteriaceae bacterium]